jgi:putative ABC transport system substrate-binding protein
MRRREFFVFAASAALVPHTVQAQQSGSQTIGFLGGGNSDQFTDRLRALQQGLSETGYVEGRNVTVAYRWTENRNDRLPELAADLVRLRPAVIITMTGAAALAAKAATSTTPIVFYIGGDPVRLGLTTSMSRPSGNLTGVSNLSAEMAPKRLQLFHELFPAAIQIPVLVDPRNADTSLTVDDLQTAARNLGVELLVMRANSEPEFDEVFAKVAKLPVPALVIATSLYFSTKNRELAALALRYRVPTIFEFREFTAAGGMMSYGGNFNHMFRQIGIYAGRLLSGEKPVNLPIQQETKAELIINLKTAKALGLTIPLSQLGRADEVIE